MMYEQGKGVAKNPALAAEWFRKAAEQDFVASQYNIAAALSDGDGILPNRPQAWTWFALAADRGITEAASGLDKLEVGVLIDEHTEARHLLAEWREQYGH